ncbi:hypothetical protein CW304_00965 [Bacillus sp. UFRGS-B20]|nr:hypothetical protein CW304_00965 [Bacillus sp. UFRGS-B20]
MRTLSECRFSSSVSSSSRSLTDFCFDSSSVLPLIHFLALDLLFLSSFSSLYLAVSYLHFLLYLCVLLQFFPFYFVLPS